VGRDLHTHGVRSSGAIRLPHRSARPLAVPSQGVAQVDGGSRAAPSRGSMSWRACSSRRAMSLRSRTRAIRRQGGCSCPFGVAMVLPRRLALLAWAERQPPLLAARPTSACRCRSCRTSLWRGHVGQDSCWLRSDRHRAHPGRLAPTRVLLL